MNDIAKMEQPDKQIAPVIGGDAILQIIERVATNPQADIDKMERLMEMRERIIQRDAEMAFNVAMAEAQSKVRRIGADSSNPQTRQSKVRRIGADSSNPQTRSKYASYAALDKVLRPIYTDAGFSLSFDTGEGAPPDFVRAVCYVSHNAGHSRTYHLDMPADGKGAKGGDVMTKTHATGSAMSYGMRYLLKMIFNVAVGEDDDDGNGAGAGPKITAQQAADIECLAGEVKADVPAFLRYLSKTGKVKIDSIAAIPAVMHKDAIAALELKRAKK